MKKLTENTLKIVFWSLSMTFLLFSCSKDDEDPGLYGTWKSEGEFEYEGYVLDFEQTLELTETSYDVVGNVSHTLLGNHDILGLRGPLTVTDDSLYLTVEEAGYAKIEGSGISTTVGDLTYYQSDDPEFQEAMDLINQTIPLQAKYEIVDGKLILTGDSNGDGDTDDDFEENEYTR